MPGGYTVAPLHTGLHRPSHNMPTGSKVADGVVAMCGVTGIHL